MQLRLEGSDELNLPRSKAFALLTDVNFLSTSMPDTEEVKILDEASFEANLKIGISFVTSKMKVRITVVDKEPPSRARLLAEGSGSGSNLKISSGFELEGDERTKMKWAADAEISGLMAGLGSTVLKGFAEKKVKEIFESIRQALERSV
jgi:carbon monoxide dehydrogenase subunit G